jgi:DNA-binding PadR family transcriptional regulator
MQCAGGARSVSAGVARRLRYDMSRGSEMFTGSRGLWGQWGPPWGSSFPFPGARPRARRGDIRAAILALLLERPMHGYEMIRELEARSGGAWRPSAGSIYPALQLLEDEGLIVGEQVEGKRRYSLTDRGRAEGERQGGEAPPWEQVCAGLDPAALKLPAAAFRVGAAAMQVAGTGTEQQVEQTLGVLAEARRRIYAILGEDG